MNLIKCFMKNSLWFKGTLANGRGTPIGVCWHDTSAGNPNIKRYVQPFETDENYKELMDIIGENTLHNDWNHTDRMGALTRSSEKSRTDPSQLFRWETGICILGAPAKEVRARQTDTTNPVNISGNVLLSLKYATMDTKIKSISKRSIKKPANLQRTFVVFITSTLKERSSSMECRFLL